jgi:zinc D-Ala-D-Ala carboxypeptidase
MSLDWSLFPNFTSGEFECRHCGAMEMKHVFLTKLQELREAYGKPMTISSGYRCPKHPVEVSKRSPGVHTFGLAADVAVNGQDAHALLKHAFALGFTGIGVFQKGVGSFVHLDVMNTTPRPNVWSY